MKVHDLIAGILLFFLAALLIMNNCLCDQSPLPSYEISVSTEQYGVVDPEGTSYVSAGGSLTITYEALVPYGPVGYWIDDVYVADFESSSYTFSNVQSDHTFRLNVGMMG